MAVQIGGKPDSGFDDPIGMLTDCHRRIERFLQILVLVAQRAGGRAMTEEESAAVRSALDYFRVGGQRHTTDKERSLFPRLRKAGGGDDLAEIGGLESEHTEANELHASVDSLFRTRMENGRLGGQEQRLTTMTRRLEGLYGEHLRLEEQVVFPRAARVLDRDAIGAIGEEFRARRA